MHKFLEPPLSEMSVMDAIYSRHAVRDYTSEKIAKANIQLLLNAAVLAPTAIDKEPWAFAIIQDKNILKQLSDKAKELIGSEMKNHVGSHALEHFTDASFNVFYNAGTLIVIYGKPMGPFVSADCWLAAENLMLAACSMGFGSCVIGSAVSALNTPEWKANLKIPAEMTAYSPIIFGISSGKVPSVSRKEPEILIWE